MSTSQGSYSHIIDEIDREFFNRKEIFQAEKISKFFSDNDLLTLDQDSSRNYLNKLSNHFRLIPK